MKTFISIFGLATCLPLSTCWADESVPSEAKEQKITFDDHIKPIFREHCSSCHSESSKESDLALDSYGGVKAGGSSGEVVAEGNTSSSRLFALLTHAEQPFMPPDQDAIPQPQIDLVKTWIEQGMPENSGSKIKKSNNAAAAMLSSTSLGKPEGPPPMPEYLVREPVTETVRSAAIAAMSASPWAPLIAIGGQEQVCLYHSQTGELLGVLPFPEGEPQSLSFTRDGKQLLIGGGRHSHSGCAVLVDIANGERIAKVGDELDIVLAADISPDKQQIAIAGPSKIVRVFDTTSGEVRLEMKKHTDWIFALRYSPDGVLLATGDRSNGLIVWEADTGRVFTELTGHTGEVRSLDFRADSNVLASGSLDGTIRLWDMNATKEIKSWAAHGGGVNSVMFAQNGSIGSAGRDSRVKLWNGNGELQNEFQGLTEAALEVALTGDAAYVAGGDWNGQVQLWPAADPTQVKLIAANPPSIEKRLEQSQTQLTAKQAELAAAEQAATAATELATATLTQLTTANQSATQLAQQVTESTTLDQTLTGELTQLDAKIKELEEQLAAVKQQRQEVGARSEQTKTQLSSLTTQSQTAIESAAMLQSNYDQQAAAATAAAAQRDAIAEHVTAAQAAYDQAVADKAALDQKQAELESAQQQSAAAVQALVQQVAAAEEQRVSQQAAAEKLTTEMQALTDQLALLQMRVSEAQQTRDQAAQNLEKRTAEEAEFKAQLEAAEQAALDAQSNLRLFQESYGNEL